MNVGGSEGFSLYIGIVGYVALILDWTVIDQGLANLVDDGRHDKVSRVL
jgi:hypothetical protein